MTSDSSGAKPKLQIRKYPNRRYYDTTHSRHLTLEEIRTLVREGHDLQVTDSKTGVDITAQVLTQIVLELETPKIDSFPVALLLQVIRSNDSWVRDFIENYFNQAFSSYQNYQKQMERQLKGMPAMPFGPLTSWMQAMGSSGSMPEEEKQAPSEPQSASEAEAMRELMSKLQRQVADLERKMARKGTTGNKRRTSGK